jgi:hypothetical protein
VMVNSPWPNVYRILLRVSRTYFRKEWLSRKFTMDGVDDGSGNEEWLAVDTVTWNGSEATLTFDGVTTTNGYLAANTRVESIVEAGTIQTALTAWTITSVSGTYDDTTYPVLLSNLATIADSWTLTFTDATNFTCTGAVTGAVTGGSIGGGDYAPDNSDFTGNPYFDIKDAGWGGTWANGDTITFTTNPAAYPVWLKQDVPAGANSLSANSVRFAISGESA